jgi:signal transduction histidine kinase/ActR/RegA family two-component response regulator
MAGLRGTQRWMEVHAVPLRDRQGAITSVLSVTREVTDRKRSEEERAALDRQLEQLQRLEAIGTLSGGIAHDFNNILAAITGNLDLAAMEGGQSPSTCEYLAEIRRASNRARALVRQILAFSCSQRPDRHVIALENIVAEVQRFMRATIPSTIAIRMHVAAGLPPVHADAAQMHQVLVNLCTNAAHAMEDRPGLLELRVDTVELEAGSGKGLPAGRYVRLEVRDTGVGMDASVVERVFEPFFTTKPVGKGSGLGLSVVHGIVQGHGGAITVESQPGRGSTFRVLLPAANVAVPEVPAADVVIPGHGEHVLVLDDEQAILRALRQGLERNGYRVTACERPDRALALLADPAQHFDVLVTDLELPGMRGLQVAQRARALAAELPIVLCSGYVRPEAAAMAGANGVGRVLVKPVALAELTTAIQELLPARKPG